MTKYRYNMYKILTQCPLFRGMTAGQIEEAIGTATDLAITKYAKNETIAHKDTVYSGLMIIIIGSARGEFTYLTGQTLKIDTIEAPELIAPAFLFGGYNRLPVDVIAESEVEILTLHRGFLFELMQDNMLVLSNFIDIISNRANVWSKKIYLLSFKSLKEKVASYLLDHSTPENGVVPVPQIKEIAEFFAATRSAMTAVLEDMQRKHVITHNNEIITILSRNALEEILK